MEALISVFKSRFKENSSNIQPNLAVPVVTNILEKIVAQQLSHQLHICVVHIIVFIEGEGQLHSFFKFFMTALDKKLWVDLHRRLILLTT